MYICWRYTGCGVLNQILVIIFQFVLWRIKSDIGNYFQFVLWRIKSFSILCCGVLNQILVIIFQFVLWRIKSDIGNYFPICVVAY